MHAALHSRRYDSGAERILGTDSSWAGTAHRQQWLTGKTRSEAKTGHRQKDAHGQSGFTCRYSSHAETDHEQNHGMGWQLTSSKQRKARHRKSSQAETGQTSMLQSFLGARGS